MGKFPGILPCGVLVEILSVALPLQLSQREVVEFAKCGKSVVMIEKHFEVCISTTKL